MISPRLRINVLPYGLTRHNYHDGPDPDTSYIHVGDFKPILVYQAPHHVKHKLNEAMLEHCNYVRKMLARIKLSQNPQVVAELFIAWRDLTR